MTSPSAKYFGFDQNTWLKKRKKERSKNRNELWNLMVEEKKIEKKIEKGACKKNEAATNSPKIADSSVFFICHPKYLDN